jgi:hypothetical protein
MRGDGEYSHLRKEQGSFFALFHPRNHKGRIEKIPLKIRTSAFYLLCT